MATPSRRSGSATTLRRPVRQAMLSGNSSTAAATSRTWIVCRSITARPMTEPRVTGTGRAGPSGP